MHGGILKLKSNTFILFEYRYVPVFHLSLFVHPAMHIEPGSVISCLQCVWSTSSISPKSN